MCVLKLTLVILIAISGANGETFQLHGPQIKAEVKSGDLMALESTSSEQTNNTMVVLPPNNVAEVESTNGSNAKATEQAESTEVRKVTKLFPADWSNKVKNGSSIQQQRFPTPPPTSSKGDIDAIGQATQIYSTAVPLIISKPTKTSSNAVGSSSDKPIMVDPRTLTALLLQHLGTSNKLAELVRKLESQVAAQSKTKSEVIAPYNNQQEREKASTGAPQFFRRSQLNDYEEKSPEKEPKVVSKSPHFYGGKGRHGYNIQYAQNARNNPPPSFEPIYRPAIQPQPTINKAETLPVNNPQLNQVRKPNKQPPIQKRISRINQSGISYETTDPKNNFGSRVNRPPINRPVNRRQSNKQEQNEDNESEDQSGGQSGESSPARSSEEFGGEFGPPVPGFHDVFENPEPAPDNAPSFVVPKIDLRPESLQQKGCKTIVKEVQQIPFDHLKASGSDLLHTFSSRAKRDITPPPRRVTSIIMTKECHFPGDETSATENRPEYYPKGNPYNDGDILKKVSSSRIPASVASSSAPSHFDYSRDHDRTPEHDYVSESARDHEYQHSKAKHDFDFDMDLPSYLKTSSEDYRSYADDHDSEGGKLSGDNGGGSRRNKKGKPPGYVVKQVFPKGGKDNGEGGRKPKVYVTITSSDPPKSASDKHGNREKSASESKGGKRARPTPKTVNRSFAVFSRDDGDEKDPNNKEYSMSYSQGKFSSFAEDYDSDRDGYRRR